MNVTQAPMAALPGIRRILPAPSQTSEILLCIPGGPILESLILGEHSQAGNKQSICLDRAVLTETFEELVFASQRSYI